MKITRKEHVPGYTKCEFPEKSKKGEPKCTVGAHWETKVDWFVPDALVRALLSRMQSDKFSTVDLDGVMSAFCASEGVQMGEMGGAVVVELMRTVKRRRLVAESGVDRDKRPSYEWVGPKGGAL